jgi:rfaE bifunctional protein kinase chain/domain
MLVVKGMGETRRELTAWVPRMEGHRVLVIGDLFLDEYVLGHATRLSREAPIPVLEFARRFFVPGGAANPAHSICGLGGHAIAVGIVGQDPAGEQLLRELRSAGIDPAGVVVDANRPTTTKTRIMAEGSSRFPQQLARVDHLDRSQLSQAVAAALMDRVQGLVQLVDAVLVSDYQTGVATPGLVQAVLSAARSQGKLCSVDAQGSFDKYAGFDLVKGNRQEIESALRLRLESEEQYRHASERLLSELHVGAVLITRGAEGLSAMSRAEGYLYVPAANRTEVFDVTGAGDTVIAVATLALLAGGGVSVAARLANYAAGLVVRRLGNVAITSEELTSAIETDHQEK